MQTVYATQIPLRADSNGRVIAVHDLTDAERFGEVVQLLPPGAPLLQPDTAVGTLQRKLSSFDDTDHIICLGDPVSIAAAAMVASSMNDGRVKVLVFDRHTKAYNSVQIDINVTAVQHA